MSVAGSPPATRSALPRTTLALSALSLALFAGCAAPADGGRHQSAPAYPAAAPRFDTLNVHVIPEGRSIRLTNTSAAPLGPGRLWLNQWYSAPIDAIPVGATVTLPMAAFRDEHGDALPGGGFFAVQAPERIVSAEVETEGGIAALVLITPPQ